ncbi:DNA-binding protein [Bradyrhizobium sp. UFLA 03-164]|uniref:DNA-binding protein n=1 Tax=Bradyrhizobium uaiense TaxID=2594946 RepID=A0A6P1BU40_9BRAD|nr:DNA-binding protein [Bradyrhizobium uaiense]
MGLRECRLLVQRCDRCRCWQFGPEWICHNCRSFDLTWTDVEPTGRIYSWERVWHPSHAALKQHGPYVALLVELPHAGGVRMVGNLLGDPRQTVAIGAEVEGVFEHHLESDPIFSLLQWRLKRGPDGAGA